MRFASLLSAGIVLGALAGCGNHGPTTPTAMTSEQEQKFQEDERKVVNEETRHQMERRNDRPQAETDGRPHRRR